MRLRLIYAVVLQVISPEITEENPPLSANSYECQAVSDGLVSFFTGTEEGACSR